MRLLQVWDEESKDGDTSSPSAAWTGLWTGPDWDRRRTRAGWLRAWCWSLAPCFTYCGVRDSPASSEQSGADEGHDEACTTIGDEERP